MKIYIIEMLALTTGLRVSDILEFKKRDFSYGIRITVKEKKTKKIKKITLNKSLYNDIKDYIKGKRDYEYIFKSSTGKNKPICRTTVWNNLNKYWNKKDKISMHTLRKTYAYHMYKEVGDLAVVVEALNHTDVKETLRYLGINDEVIDKANKKVYKRLFNQE